MGYSSDLTAEELEVLEPLLEEVMPTRQKTRPCAWSMDAIINGMLYQVKNGCRWADLPKDLPPYSTVYWHYKKLGGAGGLKKLIMLLNKKIRALKKSLDGQH